MTPSATLFLSRISRPPHQGSVGYVNNSIAQILKRQGWDVGVFNSPTATRMEEAMVPLGLAEFRSRSSGPGVADVAIYDDAGTTTTVPSRQWAKKNAVIYHGLAFGANAWMSNPDIDLHCANSPYLARVLRSLFAYPDWQARTILNAQAFESVTDISLAVPCVAHPGGDPDFAHGSDLPSVMQQLLASKVVAGHALQPRKQDWAATASIMLCLNDLARQRGTERVVLFVSEASLDVERRRSIDSFLAPRGYRCDDLFIAVPALNQRALFQLVRRCRFGLSYNVFPEPFGFYVLESVFGRCPVYTNGAGNNRFLLPPEHGLNVAEPLCAVDPTRGVDAAAYQTIAERIHRDFSQPELTREQCQRGAQRIEAQWSPQSFERSLRVALERLMHPPRTPSVEFDKLKVGLGPLVRHFDSKTGLLISDYASGVLDRSSSELLASLIGKRCAELESKEMVALERHHGFFRRGALTLMKPDVSLA